MFYFYRLNWNSKCEGVVKECKNVLHLTLLSIRWSYVICQGFEKDYQLSMANVCGYVIFKQITDVECWVVYVHFTAIVRICPPHKHAACVQHQFLSEPSSGSILSSLNVFSPSPRVLLCSRPRARPILQTPCWRHVAAVTTAATFWLFKLFKKGNCHFDHWYSARPRPCR